MKPVFRRALTLALIAASAFAIASTAAAAVGPPPRPGFSAATSIRAAPAESPSTRVIGLPGPWNGANSGSWPATAVSGDGLNVTLSNVTTVDGQRVFDWSANLPVDLAIVKQGERRCVLGLQPGRHIRDTRVVQA